jgi:GDP-mannose transporter
MAGSAAAPVSAETITSIVTYSLCSGSLLLLNKVVLAFIPSSPLVTALQCAFCLTTILGCAWTCGAPRLDALTPPVLRAYALYGLLFVGGIYTNMRSLQASNVDTVIVFRATVPLLVAVGDWLFLGREAPSARSWGAMLLIVVGCAVYCAVDAEFALQGLAAYGWVSVYVLFMALEMLLGKQITSSLEVSLGTSVLLTNAVGILPFLAIGAATGELQRGLRWEHFTPLACAALLASCALSAGIGFSSWWCRTLVSATTFTVVGVVNKVLTVLLNIAVWDKHSSLLGTLFLFMVRCPFPPSPSFPSLALFHVSRSTH